MAHVILIFRFQMCDRYASDLYSCMQGQWFIDFFLDEVYIHFAGAEFKQTKNESGSRLKSKHKNNMNTNPKHPLPLPQQN